MYNSLENGKMIDVENRVMSGVRDMEEGMEGEKVADVVIKGQ